MKKLKNFDTTKRTKKTKRPFLTNSQKTSSFLIRFLSFSGTIRNLAQRGGTRKFRELEFAAEFNLCSEKTRRRRRRRKLEQELDDRRRD